MTRELAGFKRFRPDEKTFQTRTEIFRNTSTNILQKLHANNEVDDELFYHVTGQKLYTAKSGKNIKEPRVPWQNILTILNQAMHTLFSRRTN